MKVSFIIPAYNASKTIKRTLDSIRNLSIAKDDYEIIVIDDASKDNTISTIEDWKFKNGNCRLDVIQQPENHRQGAARNKGVEKARGEYVYFCDSDDEVNSEFVEALHLALVNKLDICYCDVLAQTREGKFVPMRFNIPCPLIVTGYEIGEKYTDEICTGPWTYIYRTEFLRRTEYPFVEDKRYEDADFVDVHMVQAERVGHYDLLIYKYYYTENSTVNSCQSDTVADYVLCACRRMRFHETIKEKNQVFVKRRNFQCLCWIKASFSFRRLTRIDDVSYFYKRIGKETLSQIKGLSGLTMFNRFCIRTPYLAKPFLVLVRPLIKVTRCVIKKIRKR